MAASVLNPFTGLTSTVFSSLDYAAVEKITLNSYDAPYFAVRRFKTWLPNPFIVDFADADDIEDDGWLAVKIEDHGLTRIEFEFLEDMGLAVQKDDKYYVSSLIYLLYDPDDGLFANWGQQDTPEEKKALLGPFMRLLQTYVLPGQWLQAQYTAPNAGRLREIEEEWNDITDAYGH